ncbi:uncharacterized protein B0P05DRAFT_540438 [Gilbertella persicaria]|uniref:uncharacterized protein n=1 Tax=Gilbertella persicaria TaxID=101096 RepID=UPI002220985C|nr:uncharacterized protein B0P05DRAFT_540438 [Gilbertella persicaria]KAI8080211.1 hypothetical protein B0P05DRAFT_540438 [Gilbertella persicaria]
MYPYNRTVVPNRTTSSHYMHFIIDTMDIMDTFPSMHGSHIVMGNAPIHVPALISPFIRQNLTLSKTFGLLSSPKLGVMH